ncbi:uncharacterized protein LOC107608898 isoform X1 [Arachis ipaensis]|uniref:uncharacterized protein LOC107608898 isoform X1 n=2 Tax=Arachis ipaensis TaxID=130454 RepID=UPI0007AF4C0B|nr:uncharacterized protein LOC107608898 isoform X1 [Arachis ipaensis]XP_016166157.1 uncharacterized protein LOC107608898 isoform X1 [Arachis ipaensis]XP_016166158.1 uncharacterized protein LOC107608898 isoform X1 [Arachis ipaensis]XP_025664243.1 uncharacterized protein LOC112762586 isoform X1 [Arachis hypogaea]XP_029150234.1 uncharacterized protein LOC112762586 isoform X1 [Arachis hypogaea]
MIAKCASPIPIAIAVPSSHSHRPSLRPINIIIKCSASSSTSSNINSSEHLRSQLDHLHAEANTTTTKANNARMRLLRLSEAAEKLQKQAAISIQRGDENGAREMLFQRKKVLQALEKSKSRIELLDELSTKLSEVKGMHYSTLRVSLENIPFEFQAISLKESQLIGSTMNMEDTIEDASSPIRIVAPSEEVQGDFSEDDSEPNTMNFSDIQGNQLDDEEAVNILGSLSNDSWNEDNTVSCLSVTSAYDEFLENIDKKLDEIEAELVTVLNVSTLVLDSEERPKNSRLQQTTELLESIRTIRQRIASINVSQRQN